MNEIRSKFSLVPAIRYLPLLLMAERGCILMQQTLAANNRRRGPRTEGNRSMKAAGRAMSDRKKN